MENNGGKPLIWTGLLLIAAALLLTGYNMWESERAEAENKVIVEQLEEVIPEPTHPETTLIPEPAVLEEEIPDYILNPNMEMPTETVNGYEYIGVLEIPELELKLPVMSTWSYPRLRVAPCRYEGSVYSKNLIIAAQLQFPFRSAPAASHREPGHVHGCGWKHLLLRGDFAGNPDADGG